ncbi:MAG: ATP-dependent DNA helicase RecG [Clostridia bacterium]|nr:ATP-dependent DNA helicase RecG [Clostridia bacterium]
MELNNIKYLSTKRVAELNKMGIKDCEGLIKNFPRSYLDLRKTTDLISCYHNDVVLTLAKVETAPQVFNSGRLKYVKVYCSQSTNTFSIVWFNQPYVANKIVAGKEYYFYGRISNKMGLVSMTNPVFEEVENNSKLKGIVPVYSIKGSLTQSLIRYSATSAVKLLDVESSIPFNLQNKYSLMPLKKAYYEVHNPTSELNLKNASERIALEEYFKLITAFKVIKGDKKTARHSKYSITSKEIVEFSTRFGFEFTSGQKQAVNDLYTDLTSPHLMNRLIQGDVGSGKTAVALCAIFMAVKSGNQVAFLAPTEVLAKQNYNLVKKYLKEFNSKFLSGSLTAKEKKLIKEEIKSGEVKIVVGTHAIIQDDVEFKNLSLCVCDEQQRFGVAQRSALSDKGASVDMLVMSATPIPRTLSLIFYGDLDISTILDKPINRAEITTGIVPERKYHDMLEFVDKEVQKGNQAYFICPKIDGDDEGALISVKELYEELSTIYPHLSIGLLHGKLKDSEKERVMTDFKDKKYDILVSTTVIEVGVDVPNATVMVIYNAERFGLSQLHQLRGRVGRSDKKSYCFLLSGKETDTSKERLNAVKNCSDGFKISEIDYDIRGGGDFIGERQSGRFLTELGALKYPSSVIFFAKTLSEEAFNDENNVKSLKNCAISMYEKLKNVTLN